MNYKYYIALVLALGLGSFLFKTALLVAADPLHLMHKPWASEVYYIDKTRFSAAGIIKHVDFDSIIIGSSMAENFSSAEASQLWGGKFINISVNGSSPASRALILEYALRKKTLKTVIISFDGFLPLGSDNPEYSIKNWSYLYNDNRYDDIKVYLNNKYTGYIFCASRLININTALCNSRKNLETLKSVIDNAAYNDRYGGIDNWLSIQNDSKTIVALKKIAISTACIRNKCGKATSYIENLLAQYKDAERSFDTYIYDIARANPDVDFKVFFPPYSRLRYAIWKQEQGGLFSRYTSIVRHAAIRSENLQNLQLFGFDNLSFLDALENYRDTGHYHHKFNSMMLSSMKTLNHQLEVNNVEEYIDTIEELAKKFDVITPGRKIEQYLLSLQANENQ